MKSDFNVINPTYNDSPDVPDNAVDVTYSSNSDSIERNNNQHTSTTTTTTLRPYEIANTKFPMFWWFELKFAIFILFQLILNNIRNK